MATPENLDAINLDASPIAIGKSQSDRSPGSQKGKSPRSRRFTVGAGSGVAEMGVGNNYCRRGSGCGGDGSRNNLNIK
jgi:hypothetical protein